MRSTGGWQILSYFVAVCTATSPEPVCTADSPETCADNINTQSTKQEATWLEQHIHELLDMYSEQVINPRAVAEDRKAMTSLKADFKATTSNWMALASPEQKQGSSLLHHAFRVLGESRNFLAKDSLSRLGEGWVTPDMLGPEQAKWMYWPSSFLLSKQGWDLERMDYRGYTPLQITVSLRLHSPMKTLLRMMVKKKQTICLACKSEEFSRTALHMAVLAGDKIASTALLGAARVGEAGELDELVEARDDFGRTALDMAEQANFGQLVQLLAAPRHAAAADTAAAMTNAKEESEAVAMSVAVSEGGWKLPVMKKLKLVPERCPFTKISATDPALTREYFVRNSLSLEKPLLVSGATRDWQLRETWKRRSLVRESGEIEVMGGEIPYAQMFGKQGGLSSIKEFVKYMDAKRVNSPDVDPSTFLYVFDTNYLEEHHTGEWELPDFLKQELGSTQVKQFIMGPTFSGAPLHYHNCASNTLLYGRKLWTLFPPANNTYSNVHPKAGRSAQKKRRRETKLPWSPITDGYECLQEAGDLLFIPSNWGHHTLNLGECIGLAVEFTNCSQTAWPLATV